MKYCTNIQKQSDLHCDATHAKYIKVVVKDDSITHDFSFAGLFSIFAGAQRVYWVTLRELINNVKLQHTKLPNCRHS